MTAPLHILQGFPKNGGTLLGRGVPKLRILALAGILRVPLFWEMPIFKEAKSLVAT